MQPIMPDAIIVPLALAYPDSWWRLALAAMLGSSLGGVVSYWLGRRTPATSAIERLPLVRPAMVAATECWLSQNGPRGVLRQPTTGVPFKVFARVAGTQGLPLGPLLMWALVARGPRFLLAAYGAAIVGRRTGARGRGGLAGLIIAWWVVFAIGLWRMVVYWERR